MGRTNQKARLHLLATATGGFGEEVFQNGQISVHHALVNHTGKPVPIRQRLSSSRLDADAAVDCASALFNRRRHIAIVALGARKPALPATCLCAAKPLKWHIEGGRAGN